jgi:hypothetical protein
MPETVRKYNHAAAFDDDTYKELQASAAAMSAEKNIRVSVAEYLLACHREHQARKPAA